MASAVRSLLILTLLLSTAACSPGGSLTLSDTFQKVNGDPDGGGNVGVPDDGIYKPFALLWESIQEGLFWSAFLYQQIGGNPETAATLLPGSNDIQKFCENYAALTEPQKVNFWAYLVSAIAKYESDFNPASRYLESTMGTDDVTGEQVYSEGLLQLSYQDTKNYKGCKFDWKKDKDLHRQDPRKTIFNPITNLECGVNILAKQIKSRKNIALKNGVYWAVLKEGGDHSKLNEISELTQALPFCKVTSP
jgi:hypothetical protein